MNLVKLVISGGEGCRVGAAAMRRRIRTAWKLGGGTGRAHCLILAAGSSDGVGDKSGAGRGQPIRDHHDSVSLRGEAGREGCMGFSLPLRSWGASFLRRYPWGRVTSFALIRRMWHRRTWKRAGILNSYFSPWGPLGFHLCSSQSPAGFPCLGRRHEDDACGDAFCVECRIST